MRILLTGGAGLLGKEILKLDQTIIAPAHEELDILKPETIEQAIAKYKPDTVLHLAAATKPPQHNEHPEVGLDTNIIGTAHVARACLIANIRLVYTSTDYVYAGKGPHSEDEPVSSPYNFAWTKLGGECAVRLVKNSLILRLSFGPAPFPWEKVYKDQWNSKLYADEMAPLVLAAARLVATGVMNLGGPRTSLENYARRTRPDITTIPKPDWVPADTSLDLTRMKRELGITDEANILKR